MLINMKRKPGVLFISRRYPPSIGGMERFAFEISRELDKKVRLHKITWGGSNRWLPLVLPSFFLRGAWLLIRDKNIDVIHLQDAVLAPIGWLLGKIFNKPYIIVAHGFDITYSKWMYQRLILPYVRQANRVVAISSATKQAAEARGVAGQNLQVITLGISDDYYGLSQDRSKLANLLNLNLEEKKVMLTTGRLVKRKGVAWFVANVLPGLVEEGKKVLYLIAGDGPESGRIQAAIKEKGLEKNAMLLGRVSDEIRTILYLSSDVFVMPNVVIKGDMEGFGLVALEAASAGLPVVASNLEGISDAIKNGKNGYLVKAEDAPTFLRAIENIIKDDKLRRDFGGQAREYTLKNYSWENVASQYLELYEQTRQREN